MNRYHGNLSVSVFLRLDMNVFLILWTATVKIFKAKFKFFTAKNTLNFFKKIVCLKFSICWRLKGKISISDV